MLAASGVNEPFAKTFPQAKGDIVVGFTATTLNLLRLGPFMSDRAALERHTARLGLRTGDVHGADSSAPTSSASTRSTSRAPKAEPPIDTGRPLRPGSRRPPRHEAISPTITLHPRKHA
ncbi:hypothetical protein AB0M11_39860 [Streptomyces sp. NPDC051987]|uniref:hypothetical protein n=1 Tax=Streptomyces sp. NPDC051987 TaxID=3155808 RepID=UPI00343B5460